VHNFGAAGQEVCVVQSAARSAARTGGLKKNEQNFGTPKEFSSSHDCEGEGGLDMNKIDMSVSQEDNTGRRAGSDKEAASRRDEGKES